MIKRGIFICFVATLGMGMPAMAVIVAGANGGGNTSNNTNAAQFLSDYGIAVDVYDNVIQVGSGSGTYLGYDPATKDVWVLTAKHINLSIGSTVTIQGSTYTLDGFTDVGGDVRVARYSHVSNQTPTLPTIGLASTIPIVDTPLLIVGYGRNRLENATIDANVGDSTVTSGGTGYHSGPSRIKRWGVNTIEDLGGGATIGNLNMGAYMSVVFATDFDSPIAGEWLISNEAQGSTGDSGGPALAYDGANWVIRGIMSAVTTTADYSFGDFTYTTDVGFYKSAIDAAIGTTLIPESSTAAILLSAGLLCLRHRRQ